MCSKIANALKINKNRIRYSTKKTLRSDTYEYNWKKVIALKRHIAILTYSDIKQRNLKNTLFKIYWKSPKFNIFAF